MKAPEKIYIFEDELQRKDHKVMYGVKQDKGIKGLIEYTRTDAIIKKACDWFRKIDYDDSIPPFETTEEFIEGFKKAMEL